MYSYNLVYTWPYYLSTKLMNKLLSGILLFLFFTPDSFSQCVIRGNLLDYKGDSVMRISKPINNLFSRPILHEHNNVILKDGKFNVDVKCNKPVFTMLNFSGFVLNIVASPGDSIDVNIDYSQYKYTRKITFTFSGPNAAGHQLFNEYNSNPASKYEKIWSILKTSDRDHFINDIRYEINNQLRPFDILYTNKKIDSGFYNLVTSTIKTSLLYEAIRRVTDKTLKNILFSDSERVVIGSQLFEIFPPFDNNLYYGLYSYSYTDSYFSFNRYRRLSLKSIYEERDTSFKINSGEFIISGAFAHLVPIKDSHLKEYLFGTKILSYFAVNGQEYLKDEVAYFITCFPQSPYIDYINNFRQLIVEKTRSARLHPTKYFDKWSTQFIDSTSGSFHELDFGSVPELCDKIVFVDIWATWCGPCLEEMKYNYEIDSFLYFNNMKRVYISIDQPGKRYDWIKLIYKLNLGGYHIFAGEKLQRSIIEKLNLQGGRFSIPRYLIVKNNTVLVADAERPSNISELKEQITRIVQGFEHQKTSNQK